MTSAPFRLTPWEPPAPPARAYEYATAPRGCLLEPAALVWHGVSARDLTKQLQDCAADPTGDRARIDAGETVAGRWGEGAIYWRRTATAAELEDRRRQFRLF